MNSNGLLKVLAFPCFQEYTLKYIGTLSMLQGYFLNYLAFRALWVCTPGIIWRVNAAGITTRHGLARDGRGYLEAL